ncbi:hypothetical protein V2J09_006429 [Rumex salicifolius]
MLMAYPQTELNLMGKLATEESPSESEVIDDSQSTELKPKTLKWWAQIFVYCFLLLAGQSAAVLLGRLYYDKGGKSKWMSTLVQVAGFPIFLPFYFFLPTNKDHHHIQQQQPNAALKLSAVYIILGLLVAFNCMLYSIGLLLLPVSTYSLIGASQLAFNAVFALVLNKQKFTPYIVNSLVILTISSTLLVFQPESADDTTTGVSHNKYILGFISTVAASALYGFILSLTQLAYDKVIKRIDFRAILDMLVYQSLVATWATVIGLFASGEWRTLNEEMKAYELGRVSYVMTLVWIALLWQIFFIGSLKLITQISSLFSNVISTLGLPVVPVLAVFIFGDKMVGIKAVAMVLAIWGFVSYAYQYYGHPDQDQTTKPKEAENITA